jgi:tetratricopeptide (TPR) repeat protein
VEVHGFPPNPYVIGVPLTGESGFYGRSRVFAFIKETLATEQQDVIVLYGQRRVGKTSILHQATRRLAADGEVVPVYFDLQGKGRQSLGEVLYQLARDIARALSMAPEPREAFDDIGRHFSDAFLPSTYAVLGPERRLLLLFDEFDVLGDELWASTSGQPSVPLAADKLFSYLQDLIMHQQKLAFIFVVGRRIDELPTNFSGLLKQAAYRRVGLLSDDDARALITRPTDGVLAFGDGAVDMILSLTAGHPYFTQLMCYETYNYARANQRHEISGDTLLGLIDPAIETGHGAFNWFWEGLPRAERFILSAIAGVVDERGVAARTAIQSVLERHRIVLTGLELQDAPKRLAEWEILQPEGQEAYRFTVDLVRRWMVRHHPLDSARRDVDYISKRAVQLYDVAREAHMAGALEDARSDYQQALKSNPNHSGAQLGLAQVLYELGDLKGADEAFERAYGIDEMSARDGLVAVKIALGDQFDAAGEPAEALLQYEAAYRISPNDEQARRRLAAAWHKRGLALMAGESPTAASETFRIALGFDTDGTEASRIQAAFDSYLNSDSGRDPAAAGAAVSALAELLPDNERAMQIASEHYTRRGESLVAAGNLDDGIAALREAAGYRPDDAGLATRLATLEEEQRRRKDAAATFTAAWMSHQAGDWEAAKAGWTHLIVLGVLNYGGHDIPLLLSKAASPNGPATAPGQPEAQALGATLVTSPSGAGAETEPPAPDVKPPVDLSGSVPLLEISPPPRMPAWASRSTNQKVGPLTMTFTRSAGTDTAGFHLDRFFLGGFLAAFFWGFIPTLVTRSLVLSVMLGGYYGIVYGMLASWRLPKTISPPRLRQSAASAWLALLVGNLIGLYPFAFATLVFGPILGSIIMIPLIAAVSLWVQRAILIRVWKLRLSH